MQKKNLIQVIKFGCIGIMNTLIDFGLFYLLVRFTALDKAFAQMIATGIAMGNSYLMNRTFTFAQRGKIHYDELVKFILVNFVSMGVSILFVYLLYDVCRVEVYTNRWLLHLGIEYALQEAEGKLLAKVLSTPFVWAVNFLGSKFWVFGTKRNEEI